MALATLSCQKQIPLMQTVKAVAVAHYGANLLRSWLQLGNKLQRPLWSPIKIEVTVDPT